MRKQYIKDSIIGIATILMTFVQFFGSYLDRKYDSSIALVQSYDLQIKAASDDWERITDKIGWLSTELLTCSDLNEVNACEQLVEFIQFESRNQTAAFWRAANKTESYNLALDQLISATAFRNKYKPWVDGLFIFLGFLIIMTLSFYEKVYRQLRKLLRKKRTLPR